MRTRTSLLFALVMLLWLGGCGGDTRPGYMDVRLPGGATIHAQLRLTPEEQATGMMFRTVLPGNEGMLFIHGSEEPRSYWMFQCEIPLDIIWMDRNRRIVEMAKETPPCREIAERCPAYGGNVKSMYVLELASGMADAHSLQVGDTLQF